MADTDRGHVEPNGAWLDRTDGPLAIRKLSVGDLDNNVFVVRCTRTNHALVVDAADRADRIREALADSTPVAVVQTHGHHDHVRAWDDLREDPGLEIWAHGGDRDRYPRPPDRVLVDGDRLSVGDLTVDVLHVPGHTPGSVLYLVSGAEHDHLFSGDTLFPGGHGRTDTRADHERIMDGLETRIFARLADDTRVYPGHGDDTTLGDERPHLAEWRARGW